MAHDEYIVRNKFVVKMNVFQFACVLINWINNVILVAVSCVINNGYIYSWNIMSGSKK